MKHTDYFSNYKDDSTWRQWLSLRTICEKQKNPYSWNQVAYHYSKNQLYLMGDMNRMREGTFSPDYNWISDFNRDILGYKKGEYLYVC